MPAFADTNVVVYAFATDDAKYTEDLENGRTFSGQLTVVNPFVETSAVPGYPNP